MTPMLDPDRAYQNGAFIPGSEAFAARWSAEAAAFRATARGEPGLAYGPGARHRYDLFQPTGTARGLMVFVHGGYWLAFGRESWSHLAAGALARGWAVAMPSYTLAPQARIAAITQEVAAAVAAAALRVAGPVVVTGHSAGGHLAARMGTLGSDRLARVVPISPVAELTPLMLTAMQADLRLTEAECAAESPARLPLRCAAHVWVGAQERPAFLWQARLLSEEWACPWTPAVGRHHFDVIDDLTDPDSGLMATCLDGL
jgi:arylformamidase